MQTFETPDPISLDLEIGVGDIDIEATDRAETTVDVRPTDPRKKGDLAAADQTRVELANGRLTVKGPTGWRQWLPRRGNESVDVRISVPTGSDVRTQMGVASLHGRGRLGEVDAKVGVGDVQLDETGPANLRTGAGDIALERVVGRADIVTGSGAVRIGTIDGVATVKNSNGSTWIGEIAGDARVRAANGSISVDRAREGIVAKTANGGVRVADVAHGAVVAQSALGDIEIGIRDGVAAWLELDTKFGRVRNDLDSSERPAATEDTVEVHATTSMGDVVIRRTSSTHAGSDAS